MAQQMKKIKSENQILIMLAFFSISMGLWENFRQLWLQDNGFSATNISNIISIGTLISVLGIIIVGKYIRLDKLKTFVSYSLFIKFLNLLILLNLNNTQKLFFINISIIIDVLTSYLITTSIYPLITTIIKNNTIYSKRKLTEYLFKDVGVLIGGLLIGKEVLGFLINYNICLFISIIFLGIAIIVMFNMTPVCKQDEKNRTPILRYIMKDKIQVIYMIYTLIGATAYSTALGLKMLTFTNYLNFTDSTATSYLLIIGLIADGIGILALKYLTPKNDYITITIKFGIRFISYAIAFIANNVIVSLAAITWSILISTSYENICDGYYINGIKNEYQFRYTNLRYIIRNLGEAVGVFLCGMMYEIGLRYMLGLSAVFILFQLGLAYYLIYLRNNKGIIPKVKNKELKYIQVTNENLEIAYNIQKNEWKDNPDRQNFIDKANKAKEDYISFIVYYKDIPIGITGVYTEEIDKDSIWLDWFCVVPEYRKMGFGEQILKDTINYSKELGKYLYFRVETTYWEGRPAVSLYDKVMNFKEEYTVENKNADKQTLIYTYNFTDKSELWNNRYLGLNNYYDKCNK